MALRDDLVALIHERRRSMDTDRELVGRVLDVLHDPTHRDELLALLLAPDESVRKDGEGRARDGKVWEQSDDMHRGDVVLVYMVPVSGAERSGEDDRHG